MRKLVRRGVMAGVVGGAAYALWRVMATRNPDTSGITWEPQPFPAPPRPVPRPPDGETHHVSVPPHVEAVGGPEIEDEPGLPTGVTPWVEPVGDGCPPSHPVKAKLASGIYHVPGGANYDRTRPDRCYLDTAAAEADGLRPAKR